LNLIEGSRGSICPTSSLRAATTWTRSAPFLEANGMSVVDPPGEYYGRSYYAVYFTDPDGMKLEAMVVQAAEATAGGKEVSRRRFTAHSLELHSPLLITTGNNGSGQAIISYTCRLVLRSPSGRARMLGRGAPVSRAQRNNADKFTQSAYT